MRMDFNARLSGIALLSTCDFVYRLELKLKYNIFEINEGKQDNWVEITEHHTILNPLCVPFVVHGNNYLKKKNAPRVLMNGWA